MKISLSLSAKLHVVQPAVCDEFLFSRIALCPIDHQTFQIEYRAPNCLKIWIFILTHKAVFPFEQACRGIQIIVGNLVRKAIHNNLIAFRGIVIITIGVVIIAVTSVCAEAVADRASANNKNNVFISI